MLNRWVTVMMSYTEYSSVEEKKQFMVLDPIMSVICTNGHSLYPDTVHPHDTLYSLSLSTVSKKEVVQSIYS